PPQRARPFDLNLRRAALPWNRFDAAQQLAGRALADELGALGEQKTTGVFVTLERAQMAARLAHSDDRIEGGAAEDVDERAVERSSLLGIELGDDDLANQIVHRGTGSVEMDDHASDETAQRGFGAVLQKRTQIRHREAQPGKRQRSGHASFV